ncbi:conserved hypothetical protein [Trichinella spiralis]|uniref:hypothetical protein n=1 Tax=Trichinella spiralis TaxID=6334 RepID=UPI0001EFD836|nr:conserved hypothetical protein [Trichinella spiralis]
MVLFRFIGTIFLRQFRHLHHIQGNSMVINSPGSHIILLVVYKSKKGWTMGSQDSPYGHIVHKKRSYHTVTSRIEGRGYIISQRVRCGYHCAIMNNEKSPFTYAVDPSVQLAVI